MSETKTVHLGDFLAALKPENLDVMDLSKNFQEIILETKLFSMADISIERETELLREIILVRWVRYESPVPQLSIH